MRRGYYCYKWVPGDTIVYVGKTVSPRDRIAQERRQEKFRECIRRGVKVYVTRLKNRTEMDGLEKLLINKYQPRLNVQDTHETFSEIPLDDESMEWIPFDIFRNENGIIKNGTKKKELLLERKMASVASCEALLEAIGNVRAMYDSGISMQSFPLNGNIMDAFLRPEYGRGECPVDLCGMYENLYKETQDEHGLSWDDRRDDIRSVFDGIGIFVFLQVSGEGEYYVIRFTGGEEMKDVLPIAVPHGEDGRLFLSLMDEMLLMAQEHKEDLERSVSILKRELRMFGFSASTTTPMRCKASYGRGTLFNFNR